MVFPSVQRMCGALIVMLALSVGLSACSGTSDSPESGQPTQQMWYLTVTDCKIDQSGTKLSATGTARATDGSDIPESGLDLDVTVVWKEAIRSQKDPTVEKTVEVKGVRSDDATKWEAQHSIDKGTMDPEIGAVCTVSAVKK